MIGFLALCKGYGRPAGSCPGCLQYMGTTCLAFKAAVKLLATRTRSWARSRRMHAVACCLSPSACFKRQIIHGVHGHACIPAAHPAPRPIVPSIHPIGICLCPSNRSSSIPARLVMNPVVSNLNRSESVLLICKGLRTCR